MKKYIKEILFTLLLAVLNVGTILVSYYKQSAYCQNIHEVVQIAFNALIGIVSIWISGYFILIQLYKNSYPMEIIEKEFLKKVKYILIFSIVNILYGTVIISAFQNYIAEIYYIILFSVNILVIFYNIYTINRTFTVNTYVEKYCKKLINNLEKSNITKKEVNKIFRKLQNLFDDCVSKNEYYVCSNISKKIGEIFEKLIEHCNKMFLNNNEEIAEHIFNEIINMGLYQIMNSKNTTVESFITELFIQQNKNIEICIKIDRIDWFKKYINKINILSKEYPENENNILDGIYHLNIEVGRKLLEKNDEWLEWFIKDIFSMNLSFKYAYKNINLNYFCKLLTYIILIDIEENQGEKQDILINVFREFTELITNINDNVQDIVVNYSIYGNTILKNKNLDRVKEFIDILTSPNNRIIEEEKWNEFILYYLNITLKEWPEELGEENRKKIVRIILELNLGNSKKTYYNLLPEYDNIINEHKYNMVIIEQVCKELKELVNRVIINNNLNMLFVVLRILKQSMLTLDMSNKNIQEKLFDIFITALIRTGTIENKKFSELVISALEDTIEELDKDKKISGDFGDYIIEKIANLSMYKKYISENNFINIIYLLSKFLEEGKEFNFIARKSEKKKLLYRNIYNIGVECIENNMENALRSVSNTLGWFIIASIKNDSPHLTNYLIERTTDLFKIAKNMEVTEKTLIFMITLFTTVGTYCCKEGKYSIYLDKIKKAIENEETQRIRTAIELRTKENNMWDKLFDGNTQELTNKFFKKLTEGNNKTN